jgi:putative ABC transport system permease protein
MIKHYLQVALRNLWKNKVFSVINIVGLSVGLTCCLLIAMYIQHETSYDNFQQNGDRITRVIMEYSIGGGIEKGNFTSTKVAPAFKKNFPEVIASARMSHPNIIVKYEEKLFNETRALYADSTFFQLFSFKLTKGNPATALSGPYVMVITEKTAQKYFGSSDPMGKTLQVGSSGINFRVTGIIEEAPSNSQLKYDMIASFSSLGVNQEETYWEANYTTFLLLKDKASIASLQAKIPGFMKKEMKEETSAGNYVTFWLEPFNRIHLHSPYDGFEPNNSITYIYIIGAVALLILAIACFTYINLATARSMERAKEVGIRKVAGAFKKQIFMQFVGESVILSMLALVVSIAITALVLPAFNQLAERQLSMAAFFSPAIVAFIVFIILCTSLLAGSYPALILSGFQPIKVLKGAFKNTGSGLLLRKSLTVFQFSISVFLIISTFIIQKQLAYIQAKKLGFDREHVLVVDSDAKVNAVLGTLKTELAANPDILSVSKSSNEPVNIESGYSMRKATVSEDKYESVNATIIDEDYAKTMGLTIIAGSDLTQQDVKDVTKENQKDKIFHFILNESAAEKLGWTPQEAIGQKMFLGENRPGIVKAVIKDFHFSSLHNAIKPLVLFPDTWGRKLLIKVSGQHMPQTISFIAAKWKALAPHRPFEYAFMDDQFNKLYTAETKLGSIFNIFATIAVLLAMLGLFGLSAYAIQQRTKEIGIRKVLGASAMNITGLLSKDFLKLVAIAIAVAFPLAWWVMHEWLMDFAYRTQISWWIFVAAGCLALLIAFITVSLLAVRASVANPVKSLRTE